MYIIPLDEMRWPQQKEMNAQKHKFVNLEAAQLYFCESH